jgi:hypothetical protein
VRLALDGMTAWDAAASVFSALKVADGLARAEFEAAEPDAAGNHFAAGLTEKRQLLGLLRDARTTYGYDLSQLARAINRPLVA